MAGKKEDSVLFTARKCIELGAGKQNSEGQLSIAHVALAISLNDNGVYEEEV